MTHPTWYDEPTDECCGCCGKRNLTRVEVEDGYRCRHCRAAGEPPPCRCHGVSKCIEGYHLRREVRVSALTGKEEAVEVVARERSANGAVQLERCPLQLEHYRAKRGRMLARLDAGPRPIGVR